MNCYYCGKLLGAMDPRVQPNEHPTRRQCAECAVEASYVLENQQRPLLNLLTKVVRNPVQDPLPESLATAIARMPERFYLQCQVERNEDEDGKPFLSAVVMEKPPEAGWTIPTYFNEPPGVQRVHNEEWLEKYRYDDVPRDSVSAALDDPQSFERLILSMLRTRWPQESAP